MVDVQPDSAAALRPERPGPVDIGTGTAPEDLPHVFDRFWRAEKSRSRRTGGSGPGLPIVRRLLAAHGGTAEAASEPGAGAVFTLRLPAAESPGEP
ncbi:hypothetical protein GCM10010339_54030 [Streptomyces alanosinicus]|uniref:histidine kinase n=1 Tax=Streptomyces alanosinicus TaxID=68171 RepID=A0A918YM06_9ACTN|nr:hypothetical protein GCM10010339_54030 [Streptomyces alanosinicus]